MKKLISFAICLFATLMLTAQDMKLQMEPNSFFTISGGPSFPVGAFRSTVMDNNSDAGFAKTGYHFNAAYGYMIRNGIGLSAAVFYNRYKVDATRLQFINEETHEIIPLQADHWQFYGISAGPVFEATLTSRISFGIRAMAGVVNANAPMIKVQNIKITKEEWNTAPIFSGGINFHYGIKNRVYALLNADYFYVYPRFTYSYTDAVGDVAVPQDLKQKITAVNLAAGIGLNF